MLTDAYYTNAHLAKKKHPFCADMGQMWTLPRAVDEGVQRVQLHPIQKLGGANISFCAPQKSRVGPAVHMDRSGSHQFSLKV